ncbi:MAG: hypothetical protein GX113_07585 [Actinobacteria bacterium]|jgi:hypothetical protein|nr:hypothetical protein [Actinomycetota bacterium]
MKKQYRDLNEEEKAACRIAEDVSDQAWVYCTACQRAMRQGDLVLAEIEGALQCAYSDCVLEANIAVQGLEGWEAYRKELGYETAHWPEEPMPGECYERQ